MAKKVVSSGSGTIAKASSKYAGKSMAGVMPLPGGSGKAGRSASHVLKDKCILD